MKRAIVVDAGDAVGSLAAVRALHAGGWEVSVASSARTLASRSRACRRWHPVPSLSVGDVRFVDGVASVAAGAVVFPAGDAEVLALSAHRHRLGDAVFPYPPDPAVAALFDKWALREAAEQVGLAVPATELLRAGDDSTIPGPTIVKARRHWSPGRPELRIEAVRCEEPDDRRAALAAVWAAGGEALVQEAVRGSLMSVVIVRWDGRTVGVHQQVASRIEPADAGSSVRAETVTVDGPLLDRCLGLLDRLGFDRGLVQLEFVRPDGGEAHLIDANPRIYGSLALAAAADWNPLDLLGRAALGHAPAIEASGTPGRHYHWLEADLRGVATRRLATWPAELAAVWRWSRTTPASVWSPRDPRPGLTVVRRVAGDAARRLRPATAEGATAETAPRPVPVDFVSSHARAGGSEKYLERVMEGLDGSWVRSLTVLEDGPAVPGLRRAAGGSAQVIMAGTGPLDVVRAGLALRRELTRLGPGVIHANGVKAAVVAGFAAGRRHPLVWVKHDVAQPGAAGSWAARRSAAIVGVSSFVLETVPSRFQHRTEVVHFGLEDVAPDAGAGRRRLAELAGGATGPFVALVGRLDPGKGHLDALEAWAQAGVRLPPGASLVFVGDDEPAHPGHGRRLRLRAEELGVADALVFTGQQPQANELIAGADLVVMPSRPQPNGLGAEGLPLVALEALQAGVPVVGYDVGGLPEALGPCGRLVHPGDITGLADAIVDLLRDPATARSLAAAGPDRIRASFSYPNLLRELRRVYAAVAP